VPSVQVVHRGRRVHRDIKVYKARRAYRAHKAFRGLLVRRVQLALRAFKVLPEI
jgi:hypothetical protein